MSRILMLCHDQNLDRRVVAQAKTLLENGHSVRLLSLSFDQETNEEVTPEGIELTRIGLSHIIPENSIYCAYIKRQSKIKDANNVMSNNFQFGFRLINRLFKVVSFINWHSYKAQLLIKYRNFKLHDPLPFRSAFFSHGLKYKSDLVQVHDLPALEAGAALAKRWNVPLVYDAHELYPEQKSFSKVQRNVCTISEEKYIKFAQVVFAVNESIANEMASRYKIHKPIVLTNAIDPPEDFNPYQTYDLLRDKLNIPKNRRILLLQGGFAPHRNLNELVKAMDIVKSDDIDLVLMGFGDYSLKLKQTAEKLNLLNKRVYFLPAVSQAELLQHSASADMGIIPYPHVDLNSYYCTPNKLFEFIQACLPIVANDSPELIRFIKNEDFGFIHSMKTPEEISEAIDNAFINLKNSKWRKNLIEKRDNFTWENQSKIYETNVNKILNGS